jgi:hypothetical protein
LARRWSWNTFIFSCCSFWNNGDGSFSGLSIEEIPIEFIEDGTCRVIPVLSLGRRFEKLSLPFKSDVVPAKRATKFEQFGR